LILIPVVIGDGLFVISDVVGACSTDVLSKSKDAMLNLRRLKPGNAIDGSPCSTVPSTFCCWDLHHPGDHRPGPEIRRGRLLPGHHRRPGRDRSAQCTTSPPSS
jgi:hypothetical protein